MGIILRQDKGSRLTISEMDGNLTYLNNYAIGLSSSIYELSILGSTGPQGFQGILGFQGLEGFQGITGSQGYQGILGFQGELGITGSQGYQGILGFQGELGITGSQGYQGIFGFQGYQGQSGQGSSGGSSIQMLDTTSQISSFTGSVSIIIVDDNKSGGIFEPYSGTYSNDDGIIFTDANANKWKRKIEVNYIDLNWYGITPSDTQANNIYTKFMAALEASSNTEFVGSPVLFIPGAPTGYWWECDSRIIIDKQVKIFGTGPKSHIKFYQNIGGFKFNYTTSRYSEIEDFKITQWGSPGTTTIDTNYGIEVKDIVYAKGVIVEKFGYGWHAYNDLTAGATSSIYGNSNNCSLYRCEFNGNWKHGVYLKGADSNKSVFLHCSIVGNMGVGWFDDSFLGNSLLSAHLASNGSPELQYQTGLAIYGTTSYASIEDNNFNNLPTDTNYWYPLGTLWASGYPYVGTWSAGITYSAVTSLYVRGNNAYGTVLDLYVEADQAPPYVGPNVTVINHNTAFRGTAATLNGGNGSLYTRSPFWVGGPGDSGTLRGYVSDSVVGLVKASNEAILFGYDETTHRGFISGAGSEVAGGVGFSTTAATVANMGRLTGGGAGPNGSLMILADMYMSLEASRASFKKLNLSSSKTPNVTEKEYGDAWLITTTNFNGPKPEAIFAKYIEPTVGGTKQIYTIKGYQEIVLPGVTGSITVGIDYSIPSNSGILYYVQFVGSNATDDCILNREVLVVNRGGTVSTVRDVAVTPDYVPGSFATASFNITRVGAGSGLDDAKIELTGLPVGTVGRVHVRRLDY